MFRQLPTVANASQSVRKLKTANKPVQITISPYVDGEYNETDITLPFSKV
ncbi:hypothetical protein [Shewanella sp. UCD-KL12]|nr:hypothetical protein [Shewanella sp. UCD-KL12]